MILKLIIINRNDYYLRGSGGIHFMQKKGLLTFILFLALFLVACGNKEVIENDDQISIYTTVYPLQYFAERIGGDAVNVQSIYPPGADEHSFDPTQKAMIALADADLFFYIGLGLEGFVENAEKTLKNEHVKMIPTAESITEDMLEAGHEHDHDEEHDHHEEFDPHVWISPVLSDSLALSIKETLIEAAPEKKAQFEENFEALREDLLKLDRQFIDMVAEAPTKTFYVSHAAFGYIADTYGLEQVAVAGLNSQSEPSQKELATLVKNAKEQEIKYVLFEQNITSKLTDVIRKEIGAESLMLHNLSVLTEEDLENEEDYFSLMEHNIATLKQALSGE